MSIQGIREINFEQAYLGKAIPKDNSDKYIAKDFVLVLGEVKIKLKASDSLRDVVRKINLKSHVTCIRAKAVKGQLFLELTRRGRNPSTSILLKPQPSSEGIALDANQIIANYLSSLPAKVSTEIQAGEPIGLYVINEVDEEDEVSGNTTIDELDIITEVDVEDEGSDYISQNNNAGDLVYNTEQIPVAECGLILDKNNYEEYFNNLGAVSKGLFLVKINARIRNFYNPTVEKPILNADNLEKLKFCLQQIQEGNMKPF